MKVTIKPTPDSASAWPSIRELAALFLICDGCVLFLVGIASLFIKHFR